MSEDKGFIKDAKMLMIEEHFNDDLEDLLWRFRQVEEKTFADIATTLSFDGVNVSYEEVATWLSYLNIDTIIEKKLIKAISKPSRPKKTSQTNNDKLFDPNKASGEFCSDSCSMASFCKYFERYEGKKCIVDLQAKQAFLTPLKNFIDKTYDRDADLRAVYTNLADQVASIYQVMKRKERLLNIKGITQIERKVDPTSGKIIENEVPNPLASDILSDNKQIMAMLKELGMTPKSMTTQNSGESDPASLSRALQDAEQVHLDHKAMRALKQDRHQKRPEITSKEQLLELIQEKMKFDKALNKVVSGNIEEDVEEDDAIDISQKKPIETKDLEQDKILNNDEPQDTTKSQTKSGRTTAEVEIPSDVLAILGRINNTEGKNNE